MLLGRAAPESPRARQKRTESGIGDLGKSTRTSPLYRDRIPRSQFRIKVRLSCGCANIGMLATSSRCYATFRTVLPRACPVSLSSWARRASESGNTVSTTDFSFPASTSFAISDNCEELGWAEKNAERTPCLPASSAEGGATIETRITPFFSTFHERWDQPRPRLDYRLKKNNGKTGD